MCRPSASSAAGLDRPKIGNMTAGCTQRYSLAPEQDSGARSVQHCKSPTTLESYWLSSEGSKGTACHLGTGQPSKWGSCSLLPDACCLSSSEAGPSHQCSVRLTYERGQRDVRSFADWQVPAAVPARMPCSASPTGACITAAWFHVQGSNADVSHIPSAVKHSSHVVLMLPGSGARLTSEPSDKLASSWERQHELPKLQARQAAHMSGLTRWLAHRRSFCWLPCPGLADPSAGARCLAWSGPPGCPGSPACPA